MSSTANGLVYRHHPAVAASLLSALMFPDKVIAIGSPSIPGAMVAAPGRRRGHRKSITAS